MSKNRQGNSKKCPFCAEIINVEAKKCKHCGEFLDPLLIKKAQTPPKTDEKRNLGLAAVLSLVIPGAGQIYKGKLGAGLLWLLFVVLGYALLVIPGFILHIACIYDAAKKTN